MEVEELAKLFHNAYEEVAKKNNWDTQESCKVEFDDLPEANKQTMIETCRIVLDEMNKIKQKCSDVYSIILDKQTIKQLKERRKILLKQQDDLSKIDPEIDSRAHLWVGTELALIEKELFDRSAYNSNSFG